MTSPVVGGETIQERIVTLLRADPSTTWKALAQVLALSLNGVKYHLGRLKSGGRVRRHGSAKTGRWVVENPREVGDGSIREATMATPTTGPIPTPTTLVPTQVAVQETAQERLVAMLREEPTLTRKALAQALGLTLDGVKYHLKRLKDAGRVRRVGSGNAGRWEIRE